MLISLKKIGLHAIRFVFMFFQPLLYAGPDSLMGLDPMYAHPYASNPFSVTGTLQAIQLSSDPNMDPGVRLLLDEPAQSTLKKMANSGCALDAQGQAWVGLKTLNDASRLILLNLMNRSSSGSEGKGPVLTVYVSACQGVYQGVPFFPILEIQTHA